MLLVQSQTTLKTYFFVHWIFFSTVNFQWPMHSITIKFENGEDPLNLFCCFFMPKVILYYQYSTEVGDDMFIIISCISHVCDWLSHVEIDIVILFWFYYWCFCDFKHWLLHFKFTNQTYTSSLERSVDFVVHVFVSLLVFYSLLYETFLHPGCIWNKIWWKLLYFIKNSKYKNLCDFHWWSILVCWYYRVPKCCPKKGES